MKFKFEYEDSVFETDSEEELFQWFDKWIEDHFDDFNDWVFNQDSTLTKDNYDEYLPDFFNDHVIESWK